MSWLTTETLIATAARLHPLVLHLPIGLVILLVTTELWRMLRKRRERHEFGWIAVWLAAFGGAAAAATGWFLGGPPEPSLAADDPANMIGGFTQLEVHRWLGIGVAAGCAVAAIMWSANWIRGYRVVVVLTALTLVPAGHLGGEMTHGEGWVTEPIQLAMARAREAEARPVVTVVPPDTATGESGADGSVTNDPEPDAAVESAVVAINFERDIMPIIDASCYQCHNDRRGKGGLAMHTHEAIMAGGRSGPVVVPGDAAASEMIKRLLLPEDDMDHMPPPPREPLSDEQIALLQAWIAAGAPRDTAGAGAAGAAEEASEVVDAPDAPASAGVVDAAEAAETAQVFVLEPAASAPVAAVQAIRDRFAHVAPIHLGSRRLTVSLAAATPPMEASEMITVLEPLRDHIAELSLARTVADDTLAEVVASMPRLDALDLSFSRAGDGMLSALAGHERLRSLRLIGAPVTDAAAVSIEAMPALTELYAWNSGLSGDALFELSAMRPEIAIDADALADAPAPELEPEVTLSSEVADAEAAALAAGSGLADGPATPSAIRPINDVCPITGGPVDAKFTIVHEGRAIAFCCGNCVAQFWEDPAPWLAKLPAG